MSDPKIDTITAANLLSILESGQCLELVDVRTPAEFAQEHLLGSHLVPLDLLKPASVKTLSTILPDHRVYLICQTGRRAAMAARKFAEGGFFDTTVVEGGIEACEKAGWPVERSYKTISMERQVRIAAGSIVVLGVLLGLFVHPAGLALSALAGLGLVFAGITNTCGMARLLSCMPWNNGKHPSAS
jgi:rhodanese-related sulfurtransferase